jgi:hypothetical protein
MHKYIPVFILFFFYFFSPLSAQQKDKYTRKEASQDQKVQREYLSGTVIFKIKADKKVEFYSHKDKIPAFNKIAKEVGATSVERMFPYSKAPQKEKNEMGQTLIDLTTIYIMKYSSSLPVEEVTKTLINSGLVEYAEPYYLNYPLYVPDDPYVQPSAGQNFYFVNMKAFEAFDIENGDPNVAIGIIDTGTKWDHEDLVNNIYYNTSDPINGVDDDGDGYVDNYYGWDLYHNDNDPIPPNNEHGTLVAGIAGATTDNGIGIAGTGFNCSILPIKAASDAGGAIYPGYDAIVYAADHGAKVINLSWGGPNQFSAFEQNIINYAVINKDVVVVAAAGNTPSDTKFFPASYDNVISVASVDTTYIASIDSIVEVKASYSTYNYQVDVCAHGRRIVTTTNSSYIVNALGTSFAAPIVAGLAGLVRSKYPSLNALQVSELIRITADPLIDSLSNNITYLQEKLGKGRINMYRALTDNTLPAIRMYRKNHYNNFGAYAFSDDTVKINCYFRNYLQPTANATVNLTTSSPNITIVKGSFNIGAINTLDSINTITDPFIIYIHPGANINEVAVFRLGYSDPAKGYTDFQYFEMTLNPGYINLDTNKIRVTITSKGKIGYNDDASTVGSGFVYKGESLLYEGGLMIGRRTNNTKVSDCVRGNPAGNVDADFTAVSNVKYVTPFEGDQATQVILTDVNAPSFIGLQVKQRSYAYKNSPDDKYIIIEYDITNLSGATIDSVHAGLFCDWDIQNYNQNKANWISEDSIGYVYYTGANGIYAGVCLLTNNKPGCFSLDHGNVGGNNINPNDGFSNTEKFNTLSKGIERPKAGGTGLGFDVSQVVSGTFYNFLPNETRTIAFALVAGDDVLDLKATARRAKDFFRARNTSPTPIVSNYHYCNGDTVDVTVTPSNGTKFKFYNPPSFTSPAYTGSSYTINDVYSSRTVYVRGADSLFESSAVAANIIMHAELNADFDFAPNPINLNNSPYGFFVNTSSNATSVNWSISDGANYSSNSFLHAFSAPGTYTVTLRAYDSYNCVDSIEKQVTVVNSNAINDPQFLKEIQIYPNPSSGEVNIEFMLNSAENVSIIVMNALGEEIYRNENSEVKNKKFLFDASDLAKGIYYARIGVGEFMVVRKIIIE